jgi:hypothetical protein
MKKFYENDRVYLLRDIYRLSENLIDSDRKKSLYASMGDTGVVIEVFIRASTGCSLGMKRIVYAKVLMDNSHSVKTFRITSIEKS